MSVESWEADRACVNGPGKRKVEPRWFDAGVSGEDRESAEVTCLGCPVRAECENKVREDILAGVPVNGFYAGRPWRTSVRKDRNTAYERRCANPGCGNVFLVTGSNPKKLACSYSCSAKARKKRPPRLARVKARNS